jgi:hypothetical protein
MWKRGCQDNTVSVVRLVGIERLSFLYRFTRQFNLSTPIRGLRRYVLEIILSSFSIHHHHHHLLIWHKEISLPFIAAPQSLTSLPSSLPFPDHLYYCPFSLQLLHSNMRLSTVLVLLGTASGAFATPAPPAKPAPAAPPAANPPAKPAAEAPLPPFKPMDSKNFFSYIPLLLLSRILTSYAVVPVNALMAKIKTEEAALAKMAQLAPKIAKMPDAKPIPGAPAPAPAPAPGKPAPAQPAVPRGLAHRSLHKVLRSLGRRDTCTDATHNFRVHFQAWNAALPAVQAADRELATLSQRLDATSRAIQNLQHPRGEPVRNGR